MPRNLLPTNVLKLRGSWRANLRKGEPQPTAGKPKHKLSIGPSAKKFYAQLCGDLEATGILTILDGFALSRYAAMLARWQRLHDDCEANGFVEVAGEEGERRARPEMRLLQSCEEGLLKLEQGFGLTPQARARLIGIVRGDSTKTDPVEQFLREAQ